MFLCLTTGEKFFKEKLLTGFIFIKILNNTECKYIFNYVVKYVVNYVVLFYYIKNQSLNLRQQV
jgi:hypothetical protein